MIGIIALVLLAAAGGLFFWRAAEPSAGDDWRLALLGATVRVGLLMGAVWLAYRELERLPGWIWPTLPILLAILAVRPRYLWIAVPIVIALALLRPRRRANRGGAAQIDGRAAGTNSGRTGPG